MMNLLERLRSVFANAVPTGADPRAFAAAVRATGDPRHGDYQANGCMAIAKAQGRDGRELAREVASAVQLAPYAGAPEVAGGGFLNVRLRDDWIAETLGGLVADESLGVEPASPPQTIVVDFSSPNVAKPMHVGHIRSTVIGDSLSRILAALGHRVIRDNHLGDWGTQFGMIIWGWKTARDETAFETNSVGELSRLYRLVQDRIKAGETGLEEAARRETAMLHAGDAENRALWTRFMPYCLDALHALYKRLDITFDFQLGESFYDPMLPGVVTDLEERGLAVPSEGATVIFLDEGKAPFLIRKRDGAFTYATTDLATIEYRSEHWRPETILYVVDTRQADHFRGLFDVARRWGFDRVSLEHVAFGTVLGPDRRPFKTREGDTVGLESLLDEAVSRARRVVDENSPELPGPERQDVAEIVGLGAIKYADLSQNRLSDYVFDWDKMLALQGNTATYMQYAYARIRSISRKAEIDDGALRASPPQILLTHPSERALGIRLLRLPEALAGAAAERKPNLLTDYLFGLANDYSTFYESCPVLKAESDALRFSRLALGELTARALRTALGLLGIQVVERM